MLHADLTDRIIRQFYRVYNELGFGFLEKVYENSLKIAFTKEGLAIEAQKPINVYFEEHLVGDFFADLVVENKIILELKSATDISTAHEAQLLNYLKATRTEVGLVLNFGPKPQVACKVMPLPKS